MNELGHEAVLAAVAGHGLPGTTLALPAACLSDDDWGRLLNGARSERLGGLLVDAALDDAFPVSDAQMEQALLLHRQEMQTALLLERALLESVAVLVGAGIEYRLMKGVATCRLVYERPEQRSFSDVDLLVRASAFDDAVVALTTAGSERELPQLRTGFDRRFAKGTCMKRPDGLEVDLHRTFTEGRFGLTVDLDECFERPTRFSLAGVDILALSPEALFISSCFNAAIGNRRPRLNALRDAAEMLSRERADFDLVRSMAVSWRVEAVVARAVVQVARVLGVRRSDHDLTDWALHFVPCRSDERAISAHTDQGSWTAQSFHAVRAIPGWSQRAAYLQAVLLPDKEHLRARGLRHRDRWLHAVRVLRQTLVTPPSARLPRRPRRHLPADEGLEERLSGSGVRR